MKVIVLNLYSRNSLAIIESIGHDVEIIGGSIRQDKYLLFCPDTFFRHKKVASVFRHHDPADNIKIFQNDIMCACRDYGADAIIASGTTITNSLSLCKKEIERKTSSRVLVEDYEKLHLLADKWTMYQQACDLGINAPFSVLLDGSGEMKEKINKLCFPAVVKPRMSYAAIGIMFVANRHELDSMLTRIELDGSSVVQEKINGELHDVTACAQEGRAVSLLSQRRLKSLYDFGGGGIINITTDFKEPREEVRKILKETSWNGPIEFDFIRDENGLFFLIECNPKIWGTTFLTVAAGMNVVRQTIDIFVLNKYVETVDEYEVGLLYRWIFPECVYNWLTKPRSLSNFVRRIRETFASKNAKRTLHNIHYRLIAHQLGVIFDKAKL